MRYHPLAHYCNFHSSNLQSIPKRYPAYRTTQRHWPDNCQPARYTHNGHCNWQSDTSNQAPVPWSSGQPRWHNCKIDLHHHPKIASLLYRPSPHTPTPPRSASDTPAQSSGSARLCTLLRHPNSHTPPGAGRPAYSPDYASLLTSLSQTSLQSIQRNHLCCCALLPQQTLDTGHALSRT